MYGKQFRDTPSGFWRISRERKKCREIYFTYCEPALKYFSRVHFFLSRTSHSFSSRAWRIYNATVVINVSMSDAGHGGNPAAHGGAGVQGSSATPQHALGGAVLYIHFLSPSYSLSVAVVMQATRARLVAALGTLATSPASRRRRHLLHHQQQQRPWQQKTRG